MPLTTGWQAKQALLWGFDTSRLLQMSSALAAGAGGRRQRQVEYRGFTAAGELRCPVIRGWYRS